MNDLDILLLNSNIYSVCLNEHWLNKDSIGILNRIPNYTFAVHFYREEKNTWRAKYNS